MGTKRMKKGDEEEDWSGSTTFGFIVLVGSAIILLWGAMTLVLYWAVDYRGGFGWNKEPKKEFNLHPVLMIAGFIFFSGHAILTYRVMRCCRKIYNKLFHTLLQLLAGGCVAVALLAAFDSHNYASPPIPNLYSLHSWLGLITVGLFGLQFLVGFFSFLILMCCDSATSSFRASLVPIHSTFGIITFMLAVAACLTGLTEKAFFSVKNYKELPEEAIVINTLAMSLAALSIVMPFVLYKEKFRFRQNTTVYKTHHYVTKNI